MFQYFHVLYLDLTMMQGNSLDRNYKKQNNSSQGNRAVTETPQPLARSERINKLEANMPGSGTEGTRFESRYKLVIKITSSLLSLL